MQCVTQLATCTWVLEPMYSLQKPEMQIVGLVWSPSLGSIKIEIFCLFSVEWNLALYPIRKNMVLYYHGHYLY